jgi:hypothetical protein
MELQIGKGKPLDNTSMLWMALSVVGVGACVIGITHAWQPLALLGMFVLAAASFMVGSTWGCECESGAEHEIGETPGGKPAGL